MATRKKKMMKKQSFEMLVSTRFGTMQLHFIDGDTVELKSIQDAPIQFFNIGWHVWLKMQKKGGQWKPAHDLGSIRANKESNCRSDRTTLSLAAKRKVLSGLIECVNAVSGQDEFIKNLEGADKRKNMKRLADLRARSMELQSQLELVEIEISEIERFTI